MAKYVVLHTLKTSAEEFSTFFTEQAAEFARAMAAGETPAQCLYTWNPMPHGRTDYVFCLWEADRGEDVEATLGRLGVLDHLTADVMQVDEIDWPAMAKGGG
jgi:hypothetical protein